MKKNAGRIILAICSSLALASACSSAPKPAEAVYSVRNEVVKVIGLGAKASREGKEGEAARFYEEAYRQASSVADDEGRLLALDGLIPVRLRMDAVPEPPTLPPSAGGAAGNNDGAGKKASAPDFSPQVPASPSSAPASSAAWAYPPATAADCVALAKRIAAESGSAVLAAFASVSEAEVALRAGVEAETRRAAVLAEAAAEALASRPSDRARALRALAAARKDLGDAKGALAALDEAAASDKSLKRFAEYASARYLAASIHSKGGDYAAAQAALLEALEADRRAENALGIGADFRALGLVAEKTGDKAAAARYFTRSRDVFAAARFPAEAADAEKRRAAVE